MTFIVFLAVCNILLVLLCFVIVNSFKQAIRDLTRERDLFRDKLLALNAANEARLDTERKQWTNAALVRGGGSKIFRDESDKPKPVLTEIEQDEADELADLPPFTAQVQTWREADELKRKSLVPAAIKADLASELDSMANTQNN